MSFRAFDSRPKEAGWFGREGLCIYDVLQLNQEQYYQYLARLDDPKVWGAVRFRRYLPSMAQGHTDLA